MWRQIYFNNMICNTESTHLDCYFLKILLLQTLKPSQSEIIKGGTTLLRTSSHIWFFFFFFFYTDVWEIFNILCPSGVSSQSRSTLFWWTWAVSRTRSHQVLSVFTKRPQTATDRHVHPIRALLERVGGARRPPSTINPAVVWRLHEDLAAERSVVGGAWRVGGA